MKKTKTKLKKNEDIKLQKKQRTFTVIGALTDSVIILFFLYLFIDSGKWIAAAWALLLLIFFVYIPLRSKSSGHTKRYSASIFRLINGRFATFVFSCAPFLLESRQGVIYVAALGIVIAFILIAVFWEDIMVRWHTR